MKAGVNIIGLNHNTSSLELREAFAIQEASCIQELKNLSETYDLDELVILSTCNRTEFIYKNGHNPSEKFEEFFRNKVKADEFDNCFYRLKEENAIKHLFKVAAGIDSLVTGETQILGQFKNAFEMSIGQKFAKNNLIKVYQKSLECAKEVRSKTGISRGSQSISYIAVLLAKNIFESLNNKSVLILGAGEMAEIAGLHFLDEKTAKIDVINRSADNAKKLADKLHGTPYSLDKLAEIIGQYDIILASAGGSELLISFDLIEKTMVERNKPLFIIDIALPRNVEARVNSLQDVYLYSLDDLKKTADENKKSREKEITNAEKIIDRKVDEYSSSLKLNDLGPMISALKSRANDVKAEELERVFNKLSTLSDEEKKLVDHAVDRVINKILHDPIISVRKEATQKTEPKLIEMFKEFFNL